MVLPFILHRYFMDMARLKRKKIIRWFIIIAAVYLAGGVVLYFTQEKMLFHPVALAPNYQYHFSIPFKEVELTVNADKKISIVEFSVPDSSRKGVVLYFHGNMENINHYVDCAKGFTKNGYELWMMDYPGFGKSTGDLTEQTMYDDAMEVYKLATASFPASHIVIYGRSIGTGVASKLASIRDCRRLILESPYYSIDALARHYFPIYPVMPMTKFSFPNYQYLQTVEAPVAIFHGTKDRLIPFGQSERLVTKAGKGELIGIPGGGHNNLNSFPLFHQKLDSLLAN
jgi:alpha-beta hydrolase superfamily lysophospholipase